MEAELWSPDLPPTPFTHTHTHLRNHSGAWAGDVCAVTSWLDCSSVFGDECSCSSWGSCAVFLCLVQMISSVSVCCWSVCVCDRGCGRQRFSLSLKTTDARVIERMELCWNLLLFSHPDLISHSCADVSEERFLWRSMCSSLFQETQLKSFTDNLSLDWLHVRISYKELTLQSVYL